MKRDSTIDLRLALETLNAHRTNELVVIPFTGGVMWEQISTRPELDLPFWGSMGKAPSTGLGIALAAPHVRVWVIDGDGSLLMNLGCLVTTAELNPPNFVHIVLENGVYQTTGGQPLPGQGKCELSLHARAAGFTKVFAYEDATIFQRAIGDVLKEEGPIFISLKVRQNEPLPQTPRRMTKAALPEVMAAVQQLAATR